MIDLKEMHTVTSPLCTSFESEGMTIEIDIFGSAYKGWFLTVSDENDNSVTWNDTFPSELAALTNVLEIISDQGIRSIFET